MSKAVQEGWDGFQKKYQCAVQTAQQYVDRTARLLEQECNREIVSALSGRVKSPESICKKLRKKKVGCTPEAAEKYLSDLAGLRVTCFFLDDVYALAQKIRESDDFIFLKEKNYIKNPKSTGYKSLHLIMGLELPAGEVRVEIQLRTLAMDFWARLDHRLCYKKETEEAKAVQKDLRSYAEMIAQVDERMLYLRKRIDNL